ncbi:hypothetical protein DPMN_154706 [Dreissena polymorpha]|uniref:Uncharacterized protein n=1 Tax=Dreissena polymorpha TaxID=45954 RepID=A0A9D4FSB2_DREPO|nr:hypothetical protein DPMN_154706 [Dreissena polymorpha]
MSLGLAVGWRLSLPCAELGTSSRRRRSRSAKFTFWSPWMGFESPSASGKRNCRSGMTTAN